MRSGGITILIISIGFDQADAVTAVAARFPSQRFAIVDAVAEGDNVASYVYREAERGFLLGAVAGLMTMRASDPKINEANVIGVVGGMDIPLINANIAGYIAGAKYVNPAADVRYSYVGAWDDPARGKELALAQIDQGVDIIWGAAGRSGLGVLQAAQEAGVYAIGADDDQGHLAPGHVLTNGMKYVNNTVLHAVQSVINGEFTPGVIALGVAEGALGFSDSLVPVDIRAAVGQLVARLIAGELVPPDTIEEVDSVAGSQPLKRMRRGHDGVAQRCRPAPAAARGGRARPGAHTRGRRRGRAAGPRHRNDRHLQALRPRPGQRRRATSTSTPAKFTASWAKTARARAPL